MAERTRPPFRADHVGSLIRPPKLIDILQQVENRQPVEPDVYARTLRESVEEIVHQQAAAGVDIVSDGEFGKGRNWAFYLHARLTGMTTRAMTAEEAKDPMASVGGGTSSSARTGCGRRPTRSSSAPTTARTAGRASSPTCSRT